MPKSKNDVVRGKRIAARREHLGLSQKQLADMCGVHVMTVSKWETGANAPSRQLTALANSLRVEPAWVQWGLNSQDVIMEAEKFEKLSEEERVKRSKKLLPKLLEWLTFNAMYTKTAHGQYVIKDNFASDVNELFDQLGIGLELVPKRKKSE